jgi:aryl-alcohol dehydrogenase-like predicted oxidoreductase
MRPTARQAENLIDTANFYTGGASETFVGEFIKGHRDSVVLGTKYSNAAPRLDLVPLGT